MNKEKDNKKSAFCRRWKIFWHCNYAFLIALPVIGLLRYYVFQIEPESLSVQEITFEHAQIPENLDGTVIAFIADIHYSPRRVKLLDKVIKCLKQRKVDVLLIGGDLINGSGRNRQFNMYDVLKKFSGLSLPCGIYAVLGNHEYRRNLQANCNAFKGSPVNLLRDQAQIITSSSGGKFNLIGIDYSPNPHNRRKTQRSSKLIQPDMFNIILIHTPEDFPFLDRRAPLVLAGHTHGGQLYIPGLGSVIRTPWYERKYTRGWVEENNSKLLVSTGLGSAYTQARLFAAPEIIFVKLKTLSKK